jgi:hypothetical protein
MSVPVVANETSVAQTTPDGDRFRRSDAVAMARARNLPQYVERAERHLRELDAAP